MIIKLLRLIYNHPFNSDNRINSLLRFFKWQINSTINPYPVVAPFTEHTRFLIWKGLNAATSNLYCGLYEYEGMGFLLHFLRTEDAFLDIGANIGTYTLLASGEIGAKTTCVEPVLLTFETLTDNILLNKIQNKVKALNAAVGSAEEIVKFTKTLGVGNHIVSANEADIIKDADTINVRVITVDSIVDQIPSLIKIDVEGFETEVLTGAENTLKNPGVKAILIELSGLGKRYGYDEELIHTKLLNLGFKPYKYEPVKRNLIETPNHFCNNIYIRDKQFVLERIKSARKIKVKNKKI